MPCVLVILLVMAIAPTMAIATAIAIATSMVLATVIAPNTELVLFGSFRVKFIVDIEQIYFTIPSEYSHFCLLLMLKYPLVQDKGGLLWSIIMLLPT